MTSMNSLFTYFYPKKYDDGKYHGELKDDKRNGKGTMTYNDGSTYVGKWKDDMIDGDGDCKIYYTSKNLKNNKPDFVGKCTGKGTCKYLIENFVDDLGKEHKRWLPYHLRDCVGTMQYTNGEYNGSLKNDKRHGQGIMNYNDGKVYNGKWENDKRHGEGTMTYTDGSKYVGEWENHTRHGQGTMTYTDESTYVGEWKNDNKVIHKDVPSYKYSDDVNNTPSEGNQPASSDTTIFNFEIDENTKNSTIDLIGSNEFNLIGSNEFNNYHNNINFSNVSTIMNKINENKKMIGVILIILKFPDGSVVGKLCSIQYLEGMINYLKRKNLISNTHKLYYIFEDIFENIIPQVDKINNVNLLNFIFAAMKDISKRTIKINVDNNGNVDVSHVKLILPPEETAAGTRKRRNRKYKGKYSKKRSKKHTKCIRKKCVKKSRKKIRK